MPFIYNEYLVNTFSGIAIAMKTLSKKGPHSLEPFRQVLDVNVAGTFNVIRLAADSMKKTEPLTTSGERGLCIFYL